MISYICPIQTRRGGKYWFGGARVCEDRLTYNTNVCNTEYIENVLDLEGQQEKMTFNY